MAIKNVDKMSKEQFSKLIKESMQEVRSKKKLVETEKREMKYEYNDFLASYEQEVEDIIKESLLELKAKLDKSVEKKIKENYLTYSKTKTQIKEDLERSYVNVFNNGNVDMLIEEHIIFS